MNLRIGTRRSRLALAQADEIARRLGRIGVGAEIVTIVTSGDRGAVAGSSPGGMKGLFVAEIVAALLDGHVDLAVHSAKDLPARDPEGVVIGAVPERASPLDVLVSRGRELTSGARVGTSSIRRAAQLRRSRPGLIPVDIRGNVDTRLSKLDQGDVDAVVLAAAGLARLGVTPAHLHELRVEEMVPAPGQGTLAVQARAVDDAVRDAIGGLEDAPSRIALQAERELMRRLGGDCALPLGALAEVRPGSVRLLGVVVSPDGTRLVRAEAETEGPEEAAALVADSLLSAGAAEILADLLGEG